MGNRALLLAATALLAAGCGSGSSVPATTSAPTTTHVPVSPQPLALTVFEVRNGVLRPVLARVPRTRAVAGAALGALGLGAAQVTVSGGTATVTLPAATDAQVAEIVYTLTQFPTVDRVDVAGRSGLTRADVAGYLPPILVETPAPGAQVPSTFHVAGSASVFEATLVVEAARGGRLLARQTVTASEGAPGRGTFDTTVHVTAGPLRLRVFAPSAADGTPQHEVDVDVDVQP